MSLIFNKTMSRRGIRINLILIRDKFPIILSKTPNKVHFSPYRPPQAVSEPE